MINLSFQKKKIFFIAITRNFSVSHSLKTNPLSISDGTFQYLSDIKMKNKIEWVGGKFSNKKIGNVGKYSSNFDLGNHTDYKKNVILLKEIMSKFSPLNSYSITFLIIQGNNIIKTLDKQFIINNTTDPDLIITHVYDRIDSLTLKYGFVMEDKLLCRYRPLHLKVKDLKFKGGRINNTFMKPSNIKLNFNNKYLNSSVIPHTMDLEYYGILLKKEGNILWYSYNDYILKIEIIEYKNHHIVELIHQNNLKVGITFEDVKHNDNFIRVIKGSGNTEYTYLEYDINHVLLNIEYIPKVNYLAPSKRDMTRNNNILTFDIETYKDSEGNMIPYACGFYDGKKTYLYYLTDFKDSDEMIITLIKNMMNSKYDKYTVYAHNFGNFDSLFLYKKLEKYYKVTKVIPRNNVIISLTISTKTPDKKSEKKITLKLTDSYCLLPSSLERLGNSFKVDTNKGIFPYDFVNENNLDYIGKTPDYKYYEVNDDEIKYEIEYDIKRKEKYFKYISSIKDKWSMRDETLVYLEKDLVCLYEVIKEMDKIIFTNYKINITHHITIASLAVGIYRSKFLKDKNLLTQTRGELEKAIRSAYYGGRTEVFKPRGKNLYAYDFNSLYPYSMLQDMPVGQPVYSLIKDINYIFGFVKVTVQAPDNINIPILPCRVKTFIGGDEKLIFPTGKWTGWYFSEELKLAIQHGYIIHIHESYIFARGKGVFSEYIKTMAAIKDTSEGAMREIHKFLMNTLYGRLGMMNQPEIIKILSTKEAGNLELLYNVSNNFSLDNDREFIRYNRIPDPDKCEQSDRDYEEELLKNNDSLKINNSPPIAAATAAWARILMYPHIVNSLYTDTDSTYLEYEMNSKIVGKKLGEFKREYSNYGLIKHALFPSPKLYLLEFEKGYIRKSKGYSKKLSLSNYTSLLEGGFIEVKDLRWRRNLELETISVVNQGIRIKADFDKRNKLYSLGKWVSTSPLHINENFEIVTTDIVIYTYKLSVCKADTFIYPGTLSYSLGKNNISLIPYNSSLIEEKVSKFLIIYENKLTFNLYKEKTTSISKSISCLAGGGIKNNKRLLHPNFILDRNRNRKELFKSSTITNNQSLKKFISNLCLSVFFIFLYSLYLLSKSMDYETEYVCNSDYGTNYEEKDMNLDLNSKDFINNNLIEEINLDEENSSDFSYIDSILYPKDEIKKEKESNTDWMEKENYDLDKLFEIDEELLNDNINDNHNNFDGGTNDNVDDNVDNNDDVDDNDNDNVDNTSNTDDNLCESPVSNLIRMYENMRSNNDMSNTNYEESNNSSNNSSNRNNESDNNVESPVTEMINMYNYDRNETNANRNDNGNRN